MKPALICEWLLLAAFALWWLLSLLNQCRLKRLQHLNRLDVFGLVPHYRFFAPRPRRPDYIFEVRTRDRAQEEGPWTRSDFPASPTWRSTFWNPATEPNNVLITLAHLLSRRVERRGHADAQGSPLAHRLLLFAKKQQLPPGAAALQFRVLVSIPSQDRAEARIGFQSDWQPL